MKQTLCVMYPKVLALTAGVAMALAAGTAGAVEFRGGTAGCFTTTTCVPPAADVVAPATQSASFHGLTYRNSTFDVFSSTPTSGNAQIGDIVRSPNVDNLGSFTLTGAPWDYTGEHFDLRVTFTLPTGTSLVPGGGNTIVIQDNFTGDVTGTDNGGINIDFDNSHHVFNFTGGSFDFFVNDVSLTAGSLELGRSVPVTGAINVLAVPEPETYVLFLAGLGAVGFVARRRKS